MCLRCTLVNKRMFITLTNAAPIHPTCSLVLEFYFERRAFMSDVVFSLVISFKTEYSCMNDFTVLDRQRK